MTGTKHDDAGGQTARPSEDVVLDFRGDRIVEVDAKSAHDADKAHLPVPCNTQEFVQLLAFALGQTRVGEEDEAIHRAALAPDHWRRAQQLVQRENTHGRVHESTGLFPVDEDGIALRALTHKRSEVDRDRVAEAGDDDDVLAACHSSSG